MPQWRTRTPRLDLMLFLVFFVCLSSATAIPLDPPSPSVFEHRVLLPRDKLIVLNNSGQTAVIDANTLQTVPQGLGTDGGGKDFDLPAIIWLGFCFLVGTSMSVAGFGGWRLSTGVGIGLAGALASWAAIINSIANSGISDLAIALVTLGFFLVGFGFGVLEYGRSTGIAMLGAVGGLAFGIRLPILKAGLLFPSSTLNGLNWALAIAFGIAGGMSIIWEWTQRYGLVFGCASIGTFFVFLGVDLGVNKQAGMSRGLRFLFDSNAAHFLDIVHGGYTPPTSTQIIIGVSLAATPLLACAQHYIFKRPFDRRRSDDEDFDPETDEQSLQDRTSKLMKRRTFAQPRIGSLLPDGLWDSLKPVKKYKF